MEQSKNLYFVVGFWKVDVRLWAVVYRVSCIVLRAVCMCMCAHIPNADILNNTMDVDCDDDKFLDVCRCECISTQGLSYSFVLTLSFSMLLNRSIFSCHNV